jgi:ubiquinone/menaquinone biosynthesis C-methylase UbiE
LWTPVGLGREEARRGGKLAKTRTLDNLTREYDDLYRKKDFVHFKQDHIYIQKLCSFLMDPQNSTVLDVGCGRGYWSKLFQECGIGRVIGIDISSVGLDIARRECEGIEFFLEDAKHLKFKNKTFDLIFCQGLSLYNTTDLSSVRSVGIEFQRCLKDGGLFVFAYTTNLSGRDNGSWVQHKPESISNHLESLGYKIESSFLLDRVVFLRLFGKYAFNMVFADFILPAICRITKLRVCMVCIARRV